MNRKAVSVLTGIIVLLAGCRSVPGSREKITLNGMIYDTDNRPVVNYRIRIDGRGVCTSDIGGRFLIKKIRKGEHVFSGYGEGYLKIEEKIVVYDKAQILYIRVPAVDAKFREAFASIKKREYEAAQKTINEILESDKDNEDALYFIEVIEKLRRKHEEK